ncbi:unnamed protein product, partial [Mesorhabditis spiculigera]
MIFNFGLIFLVFTRTSKTFRSYAVLIMSVAIHELIVAITAEYTVERIIPIADALTIEFHGICGYLSASSCVTAHGIFMYSTSYVYSCFPFFFWFRYRVLHCPPKKPWRIFFLCLIIVIPAWITSTLLITHATPEKEIRAIWHAANYTNSLADPSIRAGGFKSVWDPSILPMTLWVTMPVFPCYAVSIYYRQCFLRDIQKSAQCARTKWAQQKIVQSLTIQSLLPLFPMTMAATYNYRQFQLPYYEHVPYFDEWPILSVTIISAFNPLLTIFYVQPYRNAITKIFPGFLRRRSRRPGIARISTYTLRSRLRSPSIGPASFGNKSFY